MEDLQFVLDNIQQLKAMHSENRAVVRVLEFQEECIANYIKNKPEDTWSRS